MNNLDSLPTETLYLILLNLPYVDLQRIFSLNRRISEILSTDYFWVLYLQKCSDLQDRTLIREEQEDNRKFCYRILRLKELKNNLNFIGSLQELYDTNYLNFNYMDVEITPALGVLAKTRNLFIEYNSLKELPSTIGDMKSLRNLNISNNSKLTIIPDSIRNLTELRNLSLSCNSLTQIPDIFDNLPHLEYLYLPYNSVSQLPNSLQYLHNLVSLDLNFNALTDIRIICNLTELRKLALYANNLEIIPIEIGNLTKLRELHLSFNKIKLLPWQIGNLRNLHKLMLQGNELEALPDSLTSLSKLKILNLRNNEYLYLSEEMKKYLRTSQINIDINF